MSLLAAASDGGSSAAFYTLIGVIAAFLGVFTWLITRQDSRRDGRLDRLDGRLDRIESRQDNMLVVLTRVDVRVERLEKLHSAGDHVSEVHS